MLESFKCWKGNVIIDGIKYDSIDDAIEKVGDVSGSVDVMLIPNNHTPKKETRDSKRYKLYVKSYMTRKATPEFDFMKKWNNDIPMPLRVMVGEEIKQTRGMVYMKLHGDILQEKTMRCMKCGRPITNPVSQYFGLGPECGNHAYVNPFDTEEELRAAVEVYKKQLNEITWEGWIIKSAIIEKEEIK